MIRSTWRRAARRRFEERRRCGSTHSILGLLLGCLSRIVVVIILSRGWWRRRFFHSILPIRAQQTTERHGGHVVVCNRVVRDSMFTSCVRHVQFIYRCHCRNVRFTYRCHCRNDRFIHGLVGLSIVQDEEHLLRRVQFAGVRRIQQLLSRFWEDFFLVRADEYMRTVGNGPGEVSHFHLELSALVRRGAISAPFRHTVNKNLGHVDWC